MKHMTGLKPLAPLATAITFYAALVPGQTIAAASFDGNWRVRIQAETGACPASYTLPIEVSGGRVSYSGPFDAKASGSIGDSGTLSVRFAHRDDVVNARGSLKGKSGRGSWKSPTKNCAGTWVARRS